MSSKIHYIYGLSTSNNPELIRYIGKTVNIDRRYYEHKKEVKKAIKSNNRKWKLSYKVSWLKKEILEGNDLIITVLDEACDKTWEEKEKHYIKLFKSFGAKLVNLTEGGNPSKFSNETYKLMVTEKKEKEKIWNDWISVIYFKN